MSRQFEYRDALVEEAERLGCKLVKATQNKHWKLRFRAPNSREFVVTLAISPSDHRAKHNSITCLHRRIRETMCQ